MKRNWTKELDRLAVEEIGTAIILSGNEHEIILDASTAHIDIWGSSSIPVVCSLPQFGISA